MHVFTLRDLQVALDIVKKRMEEQNEAQKNEILGRYYMMNDKPCKAIEYYLKLVEIAEEMDDKVLAEVAHGNLGVAHCRIGQYQLAIEHAKKCLEIAAEQGNNALVGRVHADLGTAYQSIGQYQMAIECHKKHLEIAEELGDNAGVAVAHENLGIAYRSIGQYQMAVKCHKMHLEIAEEVGDNAAMGRANRNLGNSYQSIGQYQMAIECHKKDLEIAEELHDKTAVGRARANLGKGYHSIGQFQMAIECHKKSLEIAEELGDRAGVGKAYGNLGNAYRSIGQYRMAIDCHKKHLEIAEEFRDKVRVGKGHGHLGIAYQDVGQYKMAIDCHKKDLEIAEELGDKPGVAVALVNLANVYNIVGQYRMAIQCQKKQVEIAEELGDIVRVRIGYANLGNSYRSIGQYQMAIEYHKKDLRIAEELNDKEGVARANGNLGIVYFCIGQYQLAMECHKKHLGVAEELGDKVGMGKARANLGNVYRSIGRYQMAIECHKKDLEIAEELGDRGGVGMAHGNLGIAYHSIRQHRMAIECFQKSLEIDKEQCNKRGLGIVYRNLGNTYCDIGHYEMAIECHKKALEIAEELGDISGRAQSQCQLGRLFQRDSDDRACRLYAKSILDFHSIRHAAVYQDEFNTSMSNGFTVVHRHLFQGLLNLNQVKAALLVSDNGKANALFDLIRKYVDVVVHSTLEDQQITLFQEISDDPSLKKIELFFDIFLSEIVRSKQDGSVAFYSFDPSDYLHMWVISGGAVFHEQWQTGNGTSAKLFLNQIVKTVRKSLFRGVRECCIPYPENFGSHSEDERNASEYANVHPMREKECTYASDLEKRILSIFTKTKSNRGLDHGRDPWVEKCVRDRYHLEGASQSHSSSCYSAVWTTKGTGETEKKLCEYYSLDMPSTTSLSRGRGPEAEPKSLNAYTATDVYLEKLYSILIAPIEGHLAESKLVIVPDGPLFLLPFCALLSQKEGHLCEKYSLQFTPALKVLNASLLKPLVKLGPSFFVGNPIVGEVDFSGKTKIIPPLPNATVEARECAKYFDADPVLEENATKAKVLMNMKDASVIHIAAHAHVDHADIFLAPNEGAPKPPSKEHYLLTAKDVLQCHLKARLVVLSCCHSGRGEISNEGVVGIARSFLGAGARSVLVTLWKIPDEETMEFMKLFYDKVRQGISVCSALQETMITLKKKFSVAEWAPFQIVGEDIALSKEDMDEIRRESLMSKSRKCFES